MSFFKVAQFPQNKLQHVIIVTFVKKNIHYLHKLQSPFNDSHYLLSKVLK